LEEAQVTVSDNLAVLGAALARGAGAAAAALPGAEAGWDQAASAAAGPVGRPVGGALAAVSAESSLLPPPLPPGVWRPGRLGGVLSASSAPPYSFPALAPDALLADLPAPLAAAFRVLASPRARGGAQKRRLAEAAAAAAAAAAEGAPPPASTPLEPWWWGGLDTKPPAGPLQTEAARRRAAAAAAARAGISSLRDPARRVAIFTTAALPWMTGTAVNPLLRAAYLSAQDPRREVTLYVPWLAPPDQAVVYPARHRFATPADQAAYVRTWARERTGLPCGFRLEFYPGRYAPEKGSILPVGDLTALSSADVAVLEEPEHLTWYHHGARWADRFAHVVGVVHTNYLDYAAREEGGALKSAALRAVNELVCRVHCHKVVKLSDAVQRLPRETTQFVHGVPGAFLDVGRARAAALAREHGAEAADAAAAPPAPTAPGGGAAAFLAALLPAPPRPAPGSGPATAACFPKGAYFIGKAIWAKGYTELLDLMEQDGGAGGAGGASGRVVAPPAPGGLAGAALGAWARATARAPPPAPAPTPFPSPPPPPPHIDCFGAGDDLPALKQAASARALPLTFHGGRDHLDPGMHGYRVLVNPSTSDVVATTTAEALAMGKWVLVADLPCNAFFAAQFRNCLTYRTPAEFSARLRHALATDPHPLSGEEAAALSWEAATQRFLDATELTLEERPTGAEAATDRALGAAFNALTGLEPLRELVGAGSGTRDAPPTLDGWAPAAGTGGGFFDSKDRLAKAAAVKAAAAAAAGGGGGGGGKKRGKGARLAAAAS
jgi:digalactosyldiacylglycerol synthase